jgi:hypothetical protein
MIERQAARHPLRARPKFRLARPEERAADEHVVTFVGGPGWIPGAMQTPTA